MEIQKIMTLMGDRLSLSFFINYGHTIEENKLMLWFEDSSGNVLDDLGDNPKYHTIERFKELKKEVKSILKDLYPQEKGLYKEYKALIEEMWSYVI